MTSRSNAVLVGEDEVLIRRGIAEELEAAGFTAFEAANADAAILIFEAHPEIGLLFTDIDMPGSMDGMKLAAVARRRWPSVKIIVTSGYVRFLDAGLLVFGKPYDNLAVVAALRKMGLSTL
jgi:YesN/AraC family two-component response regulator